MHIETPQSILDSGPILCFTGCVRTKSMVKRLLLIDEDRETEVEFCRYYDRENRSFIQIGIAMSVAGWSATLLYIGLYFQSFLAESALLIALVLLPLFTLLIVSTYSDRWVSYYQQLSTLANVLAGLMVTYLILHRVGELMFAAYLIMSHVFYSFFMLRIRVVMALPSTLFYVIVWQFASLFIVDTSAQFKLFSTGIWITQVACVLGGRAFESASRRIFVQNRTIEKQQIDLQREMARSERLLLNILPAEIAERLKAGEEVIADRYDAASVLFADIVDFTALSATLSAEETVRMLNEVFSEFDTLVGTYGFEKIKTIGDAYMVVSGVPRRCGDHATGLAALALEMLAAVEKLNSLANRRLQIRVGINSGPVVAGIIGKRKFLFDLWGDTVNVASRMEAYGTPDRVQVTEATRRLVSERFNCEARGTVDIKGKGPMACYYLVDHAG